MTRICSCHGQPMEFTGGNRGGWRCVIRRRENQLRLWHEKRKHDPVYQLERKLYEMTRVRVRY